MRRRKGESLLEVLVALCLLGVFAPLSLDALNSTFLMGFQTFERAERMALAEWWFAQLERPVTLASLESMPDSMPKNHAARGVRFTWQASTENFGAVRILLKVAPASQPDRFFTVNRVY